MTGNRFIISGGITPKWRWFWSAKDRIKHPSYLTHLCLSQNISQRGVGVIILSRTKTPKFEEPQNATYCLLAHMNGTPSNPLLNLPPRIEQGRPKQKPVQWSMPMVPQFCDNDRLYSLRRMALDQVWNEDVIMGMLFVCRNLRVFCAQKYGDGFAHCRYAINTYLL